MRDGPKVVWSIPYVSVAFFPSLKQNFIVYRSSKVSSRPNCIFENHQLWQSGFSSVYSNSYCRCSFEPEIIKIGQSHLTRNIVEFRNLWFTNRTGAITPKKQPKIFIEWKMKVQLITE